jgi:Acetyltransferase (GNAT) family
MQVEVYYLKHYPEFISAVAIRSYQYLRKFYPDITIKGQIRKFKRTCNTDQLPLTLIALDENQALLGMCLLESSDNPQDWVPCLSFLYVISAHRHKDIDKTLISKIIKITKRMGYQQLYAVTFDKSQKILFEKLGWSPINKDRMNGHPVLVFKLQLD